MLQGLTSAGVEQQQSFTTCFIKHLTTPTAVILAFQDDEQTHTILPNRAIVFLGYTSYAIVRRDLNVL